VLNSLTRVQVVERWSIEQIEALCESERKKYAEIMKPHQERVVAEKKELDEKLDRLTAFFKGDTFESLSEDEKNRMSRQHRAMTEYSTVLGERIANFE
jgi:uncharacterized protein YukE